MNVLSLTFMVFGDVTSDRSLFSALSVCLCAHPMAAGRQHRGLLVQFTELEGCVIFGGCLAGVHQVCPYQAEGLV